MLEALHQNAAFLFDAQVERAARQSRALLTQPPLRHLEKGGCDLRVVLGLKKTEETGIFLPVLVVEPVDLRAYAARGHAVAAGKKETRLAVLEKRILLRVYRLAL